MSPRSRSAASGRNSAVAGIGPHIAALLSVLLAAGCDANNQAFLEASPLSDASVVSSADAGAAALDAAVDDSGSLNLDAGTAGDNGVVQPNPVFIGLVPNVEEGSDAGPLVGNAALESELDALALGSRARWFRVSPTDVLGLSRIEQQQNVYRAGSVRVGLSIDCEDALRAPERTPALTKTYQDLVTRVLKSPVPPLFVTFGIALNVSLADYEDAEREARVQWVKELIAFTRLQMTAGRSVGVGVSLEPEQGEVPDFELIESSDVIAAAWLPMDTNGDSLLPEQALLQLTNITTKLADQKKALILTDVGYAAAEDVGSSEAQQAKFYALLFDWIGQNRDRLPFVSVAALHEYSASDCNAWAAEYRLSERAGLARCSVGLHTRGGAEKLAFEIVANGMLRFFAP